MEEWVLSFYCRTVCYLTLSVWLVFASRIASHGMTAIKSFESDLLKHISDIIRTGTHSWAVSDKNTGTSIRCICAVLAQNPNALKIKKNLKCGWLQVEHLILAITHPNVP